MKMKAFITVTLGIALLLAPAIVAFGQDPSESVADAARKAQEQKKTAAPSKLVIDNDNLNMLTGTVSVVGELPPPPEEAKEEQPKTEEKKAPVKDEAYWRQTFADAYKKLADDAHELDILQREYNLKQQQYYSDPNTAMKEQYTRQDLTDTKQKIDDKTVMVAQDKQAISDLEDALRQAGGDPGWANPPSAPSGETPPAEAPASETPAPATPVPAAPGPPTPPAGQ